jgi:hypothetical protein
MRDLKIYIKRCHFSCASCNGVSYNQCLTCPMGVLPVQGVCKCPNGFISNQNNCIEICPLNYLYNPKSRNCELKCIAGTNCQTCFNEFLCAETGCGTFGYYYNG